MGNARNRSNGDLRAARFEASAGRAAAPLGAFRGIGMLPKQAELQRWPIFCIACQHYTEFGIPAAAELVTTRIISTC